jgi:uncharacterized protein (TIGR03435 family)
MLALPQLRQVFFVAAWTALGLQAQTNPAPAFDVASIRVNSMAAQGGEGSRRESTEPSPGSLIMRNVRMRSCITWAYHVAEYQVSGPAWIDSERYDIAAKAAGPAPESEMRVMLQTLLTDRFKLVLHRQNKEMSVFVLLVGKNGHKLKESEGDGPPSFSGNRVMVAQHAPMSQLAELLSGPLRIPVLDMTELKGRYDFSMDPSRYLSIDKPQEKVGLMEELPAIFRTMVQEQLGLRLEPRKAPVEILVIDSVEKAPTEN